MDTWQTVVELPTPFEVRGASYKVVVEGDGPRQDGTWAGRIVFRGNGSDRVTGQETSQPNRAALEYWATGLETIYLEGAFGRASG
jgi:hypothetical protein